MVWYDVQMSENDYYTKLLHPDGAWHAENRWNRDEIENHIESARQTTDQEVRQEHYSAIQQLMYERGPYAIPVYFPTMSASQSYVNNYNPHPMTFKFHADNISLGSGAPTR
jgi:ABC-type transport system substrate-binding protein